MIVLVAALECEARPLISHFGLQPADSTSSLQRIREVWRIHQKDDVVLVVSGVGIAAAAAAVGAVHAALGEGAREQANAWLNVGVAGSASAPLGSVFLAHKVVDTTTGRSWYPPQCISPSCPTATVSTVPRPLADYPEDGLCDMEAAGFLTAATRFSSAELVQVLKVVSDNEAAPAACVTPQLAGELVSGATSEIGRVVASLLEITRELRAREAPPRELTACLERWRFTVTQERQLRRLLTRLELLLPGEELWTPGVQACRSAKELLEVLSTRAGGVAVRF